MHYRSNAVFKSNCLRWLKTFFNEDNIVLDEKLRNYFLQNLEKQEDYETQKAFSLKGVTTEEACASCINQLLSFSKDDLKQLLYTIYRILPQKQKFFNCFNYTVIYGYENKNNRR